MNKEQLQSYIYHMHTHLFGELDPNYDPEKDVHPQGIYRRHEFAEAAEYLMSFRNALIEEFLEGKTLPEVIAYKGRNVMQKKEDRPAYMENTPDPEGNRFHDAVTELLRTPEDEHTVSKANPEGWKNIEFKYHSPDEGVHWDIDPDYAERNFPTAYNLIKEFWDDCPIASYSCMAPNTVLHRHTGPENRFGEYIRIHIPLIIPPGDVFFEVDGEEIDWSDIFGFDNQLVHSAHNLTNEFRLIFLIDIKRSRIGLPSGQLFNKHRQLYSLLHKPFVRKLKQS
jgi:hypothetical protein